MKKFIINWNKNVKYGEPIIRKTTISTSDAQNAVQVFMKVNGNLKKNEIHWIQEIDSNGMPVGERIIPE